MDKEIKILEIVEQLEIYCEHYTSQFTQEAGDWGDASVKIDKTDDNKILLEYGWNTYEEGGLHKITILVMSHGKSIVKHWQDGNCVMAEDTPPDETIHKFNTYDELLKFLKDGMT